MVSTHAQGSAVKTLLRQMVRGKTVNVRTKSAGVRGNSVGACAETVGVRAETVDVCSNVVGVHANSADPRNGSVSVRGNSAVARTENKNALSQQGLYRRGRVLAETLLRQKKICTRKILLWRKFFQTDLLHKNSAFHTHSAKDILCGKKFNSSYPIPK
jgi:hypothetical protein